mgnify:FL=1
MAGHSPAAGDYGPGLEPSNASVYGRPFHEKEGTLHRLAPFAAERNELRFTVLDGGEELRKARDYIAAIKI